LHHVCKYAKVRIYHQEILLGQIFCSAILQVRGCSRSVLYCDPFHRWFWNRTSQLLGWASNNGLKQRIDIPGSPTGTATRSTSLRRVAALSFLWLTTRGQRVFVCDRGARTCRPIAAHFEEVQYLFESFTNRVLMVT